MGMKRIRVAIIGLGSRGKDSYAVYQYAHPDEMEIVAIAEPKDYERNDVKEKYNIKEDMCFDSWEKLFDKGKIADAVMICTMDKMHFEPTMRAIAEGYKYILLEKPISPDFQECISLEKAAKENGVIIMVAHVLRYTPFFGKIKELIDNNELGDLISIVHNENVGSLLYSHAFIRGNWRKTETSAPMILAKACHDMDILLWLVDSQCKTISSFGSLKHFKSENAPEGVPKRCMDGCAQRDDCPYYAPREYLVKDRGGYRIYAMAEGGYKDIWEALEKGSYGRCVYYCDNDVVDHQVVNMEFENGVTAVFTMCAFAEYGRDIKIMGTKAVLTGNLELGNIKIHTFATGLETIIDINKGAKVFDVIGGYTGGGHSGGDANIMKEFIGLVGGNQFSRNQTDISVSVQSHLMSFAAEESRLTGKIININDLRG